MTATLEFVGTATTVLRLGPFTVLTDPNFLHRGQRAYLGKGLFSRRTSEPALQPEQLPPLDAVVLSHLHGDHFDRVARRRLDRSLPVFTTAQAARRLRGWGFGGAEAMPTWQSTSLERDGHRLTLTAVPGRHGRGPARALLPPVMGSVLELTGPGLPRALRIYLSGDTLYHPWLAEITERTGALDAAVLHLGGTRIAGMLVTMDDAQGADLAALLRPAVTVPVHYDDYPVFRSPLQDFVATCRWRELSTELRTVRRGECVALAPTDLVPGG